MCAFSLLIYTVYHHSDVCLPQRLFGVCVLSIQVCSMMAYGLDCAFRYTDIYQVPVDRRCRDNGHLAVSLAKVMGHMHISLYAKENDL